MQHVTERFTARLTAEDFEEAYEVVEASLKSGDCNKNENDEIVIDLPDYFGRWRCELIIFSVDEQIAKDRARNIRKEMRCLQRGNHLHIEHILGHLDVSSLFEKRAMIVLKEPVLGQELPAYLVDLTSAPTNNWAARKRMKSMFPQLISALNFVHQHGISHGNIVPSDIICHDDEIYLSGFSFQQKPGGHTRDIYLAPGPVDAPQPHFFHLSARDVFALGLVFAEILTFLLGSSVQELRRFVHQHRAESEPYREQLGRLDSWFMSPDRLHREQDIYRNLVRFMLSIVPRSRPSASDLVNILRERGPILFSLPEFPPGCSLTTRVDPQKLVTGWQLGGKQFLWEEDAQTVLEVTSRGVLGRGQTAEVEEVRVPGSNVTLARKRVAISRAKTLGGLEKKRIRAEIEIIRSLDHQHIVKVIGCYQKPRGRYIADLCVLLHPAADSDLQVFLGERCKNASHTERGWLGRWFTCLSSALAYLHYHGIHHEDIKPGNIVHRGRDIYFTDFSSSRRVISWDETSTESPAVATRLYAAPEAMSSGSQMLRHGSQSDVYSLGLVFVEMLTVLMLHQIGGLRAFLFSKPGDKHQYHHVTHKMGMWFEESHAVKPLSVFVLSNMLAANRRERVSAQTVADYFVHSETLFNMGSCGCHWLRWERPKGITGPRDCTNTNPELCGCTNAEPEPRDGTNIEADDDFVIV